MDSGNSSSSCKEFNSQSLFITNANNNGFSISNTTTAATAAVPASNSSSNKCFSFLDSISFLPPTSPFPIFVGPPGPDSHVPAQPAPANTSSSPRSTSTTSSKKRSRPSRRAPTTVLTTDTSNFRAMVQEFTGIPSPPPSSSSSSSASPYRFATPSAPSFLQLKPYPHNPSYHHLPPPPPPPSLNFGLSNPQLLLLQSQLAMKAQTTPSTWAAAVGYGSAADLGQQLTGVIGSGWGQDAGGVDPTSLLTQVIISNGACCELNNYSD